MKKTIKIIDLYNMISKGSIPKKIKYNTKIYEYDEEQDDYSTFVISHYEYLLDDINVTSQLNDEVEILDEEEFEDIEENNDILRYDSLEPPYGYNEQKFMKFIIIYKQQINKLIRNQKKIIERLNDVKDKR